MDEASSFSINPGDYFLDDVFAREIAVLAERMWTFVGLAKELASDNDFVTVSAGRKSVIVQNFRGKLSAFENVCAHRFARLRSCEKGNGILRCPYHSWVYNGEGVPVSIPSNETAFGFDQSAREKHALRRWQVEQCGELIFIREGQSGPALRDVLGDMFEELQILSQCIGEEVDSFTSEYQANWKICVENSIDEYHASFVHPTTFRSLLSNEFAYHYDGLSSKVEAQLTERTLTGWRKIERHFASRPLQTDFYRHYLLFPTCAIASTFGAHFSIQTLTPLSPSRTLFRTRLFLTKFPDPTSSSSVPKVLGQSAAEFNRTVFLEDKVICERVQLGLQQVPTFSGTIGKFEERIRQFHASMRASFV